MTAIERVVERLAAGGHDPRPKGAGDKASCPAHDDRHPSLDIDPAPDRVLITCRSAGCSAEAIAGSLGLTLSDLFDEPRNGSTRSVHTVIDYRYTDEQKRLLYTVKRFEPASNGSKKSFALVPASGRVGAGAMNGVQRVLYRLPEVRRAVGRVDPVYVVEGEKDADAIARIGSCATTNCGGAGKWTAEYSKALVGADVVIVADEDIPGYRHAASVRDALVGLASRVAVMRPERGKDVADHLAAGLGLERLVPISDEELAGLVRGDARHGVDAGHAEGHQDGRVGEATAEFEELTESWQPVDLRPVLAGSYEPPIPAVCSVEGTSHGLFYRGAVNEIHGDSGIGKSWLAAATISGELWAGSDVLVLDYEGTAEEMVGRLLAMGTPAEAIVDHLMYMNPATPAGVTIIDMTVARMEDRNVGLVVIDSLGEAFGVDGVNEDRDNEVGPWLRRVARRLAEAGPAVVIVDHATKAADNPLHPSGSKRKRAAITGAAYLVTTTAPPTRQMAGTLHLTCAKDRHGTYRRGAEVAVVSLTPFPEGRVELHVRPGRRSDENCDPKIELVMRAVVRAAKAERRALSTRVLIGLVKVRAGTDAKRAGVELAYARGYLAAQPGSRNAVLYTFVSEPGDDLGVNDD